MCLKQKLALAAALVAGVALGVVGMELGWYWLTWVAGYLWGVASAWALAWRVAAAMAQRAAFRAIRRFAEARMRIAVMSAAEEGYTEEQLFEMLDDVFGEQQKDGQK